MPGSRKVLLAAKTPCKPWQSGVGRVHSLQSFSDWSQHSLFWRFFRSYFSQSLFLTVTYLIQTFRIAANSSIYLQLLDNPSLL